MHIQTNINHKHIGGAIALSTIILLTMLLCPITNGARAYTENYDEATSQSDLRTTAKLWNKPTIAVALADSIEMNVIPKSTGVFTSGSAKLTVETNSKNGLRVLMNATNGADLTSDDKDITSSIQPISTTAEGITANQFGANRWGYYVGNAAVSESTRYHAVPTITTEVFSTPTSGTTEQYNIAFGASIDTNLPAGMYSNSVLVSVVANPIEVTLSQISTMQEMTAGICEATSEGTTTQLIDTRDNNKYWVAKMKDGRCWMTQNLDLDITAAGLKASDTDISADWNNGSEYPPVDAETSVPATENDPDTNSTRSWNFGKWVLATPLARKSCETNNKPATSFSDCTKAGFVNVSDAGKFSPTYTATTGGSWTYSDGSTTASTTIAVNCAEWANNICIAGTYDPHYLIGNYYQWVTATAGTGGAIADGNATGSICPKNWQLPTSGSDTGTGSFAGLLTQYGITNKLTGTANGVSYDIARNPLYFVSGGSVSPDTGGLYDGGSGILWSSTASNTGGAYDIYIARWNSVLPSDANGRYRGFSIRCLNAN